MGTQVCGGGESRSVERQQRKEEASKGKEGQGDVGSRVLMAATQALSSFSFRFHPYTGTPLILSWVPSMEYAYK